MNAIELKSYLHSLIDKVNDMTILNEIKAKGEWSKPRMGKQKPTRK